MEQHRKQPDDTVDSAIYVHATTNSDLAMAVEESDSEYYSPKWQHVSAGLAVGQIHTTSLKILSYVILFSIFSPISVRWLQNGPTVSDAVSLSAAATDGTSMTASGSRQSDAVVRDPPLPDAVRAARSSSFGAQQQRQSSSAERRKSGTTASTTSNSTKLKTGAKVYIVLSSFNWLRLECV